MINDLQDIIMSGDSVKNAGGIKHGFVSSRLPVLLVLKSASLMES